MPNHNYTDQITHEYQREEQANKKAVNLEDIPFSYEAITTEWLTHVLCRHQFDATVTAFELDEADNGMTDRRRIFITYNQAGEAENLPVSIFCKATQNLQTRIQNANAAFIQGEDLFYNHFQAMVDIETSHCLWSNYDPVSFNSILVFDDLARQGAEFCTQSTVITKDRAISQVKLLARLHGRFYQSPDVLESELPTFEDMFHDIDAEWNFEKICDDGFVAGETVIPSRLFQRRQEIWPATLKSVTIHSQQPRTLTHNDVHLRNWYVTPKGEMGITDWQCLGKGHWARDLSYALSCALTVENRRQWEKELIRIYLDHLQLAGGPAVNFDQAWQYYRQHLFSALSFWTSTLAVQVTQPAEASLEFVKRITTAIDDLDALDLFAE